MEFFPYTMLDPVLDDRDYVLSLRNKAQQLLLEGKTVMKWSGEGNEGQKEFVVPIENVLSETRMCLRLMDGILPVRQSQQWRLS